MTSKREREVYLYMFDHANADGFLTTSGVVIGKAIGLAACTVSLHLRKLEARGEVYRLDSEDDPRMTRFAVKAKVD